MTTYRRKPELVEAHEWSGEQDKKNDPKWFTEAIEKGNAFYSTWNKVKSLYVFSEGYGTVVYLGDYVVKKGDEFYVMSESDFLEEFEIVD